MHIRAGERLRLTLWGAGGRAMVSVNAYAVTQPAIEGIDPSEDGFTYEVTSWLHPGRNTLTVVLIGPVAVVPFRMAVEQDDQLLQMLDESALLPLAAPWRLWTKTFELALADTCNCGCSVDASQKPARLSERGMSFLIDHSTPPCAFDSMLMPGVPASTVSVMDLA